MARSFVRSFLLLAMIATAVGIGGSFFLSHNSAAHAQPAVGQQPQGWQGVCGRCGEGYTWLGANRPAQSRCSKFLNGQPCNGGIIWTPY